MQRALVHSISIHAPQAGCDQRILQKEEANRYFDPRTPSGVRPTSCWLRIEPCLFRSTHPKRGATASKWLWGQSEKISIHAPQAGCDGVTNCAITSPFTFRSTHPKRGATEYPLHFAVIVVISIHAPQAGCDNYPFVNKIIFDISIHAPQAGCDRDDHRRAQSVLNFDPRTPSGVRQFSSGVNAIVVLFRSTHPMRGATASCVRSACPAFHFDPRTPCGVRPAFA